MPETHKPMKEIKMKLSSGEDITGLQASCGCVYTHVNGQHLIMRQACHEHGQDPTRLA